MWANMRIIVLLNTLKVGSLRTRQMLKVDLCANGAGAYAPYAPPCLRACMCCHTTLHLKSLPYGAVRPGSADISVVLPATNSKTKVDDVIISIDTILIVSML